MTKLQALSGLLFVAIQSVGAVADDRADSPSWYRQWWDAATQDMGQLVSDGGLDLYLPLRTYHLPVAYSAEQRERYNDIPAPAFGLGLGHFLENGNWHGLYAMGFRDSNSKASWMAGYSYRWLWSAPRIDGYYGVGSTVFLMSREDYFGYKPFPGILPLITVGFRNLAIETAYVPGGKGNGNILFLWLKLEEKERPRL